MYKITAEEYMENIIKDDSEAISIYNFIASTTPHRHPLEYPLNDVGLYKIFKNIFGKYHKFCTTEKTWYAYSNGKWEKDETTSVAQSKIVKILYVLKYYIKLIANSEKLLSTSKEIAEKQLKDYLKFLNKSESEPVVKRVINLGKYDLSIEKNEFNSNKYLLNFKNGVYDLKKKEFRKSTIEDMLTLYCDCEYKEEMDDYLLSKWLKFINEITENDYEKSKFLQRALGYSLLGENECECMFIAYGETRSGKGTLFNSISAALGLGDYNYSSTISSEFLCKSRYKDKDYNAATPMLASTVGKRILNLSETDKGALLDVKSIKQYTGNDPIRVRELHKAPFTFTPIFKIWLQTNYLPRTTDDTIFTSDRVWVIEFNRHFNEEERDVTLKSVFRTEEAKNIIMHWLIDGYNDYVENGLTPPKCVREANERYILANDTVLCFMDDMLEENENARISNKELYQAYIDWCCDIERDYKPVGTKTFYSKLSNKFNRIDANGFRGFDKICFK